ncbi:metal ABC transporter ATP-binding protein [Candidatus Woesebacteria bacterium]|nr:metal ABC transporter ATP-binding protein [Candidatus Woesebacteria bacterium]
MTDDILVKIEHVSFGYREGLVLDDINFEIKKGEFLGIIGPNGSGKTTLLKILLGLLKPSIGKVSLFGQEIQSFKDWEKIGYVPQRVGGEAGRFPITVEELVSMSTGSKQIIKESLSEVDMQDYSKKLIKELSGGQCQRVFIARALATKPELLVLDEPTVGIDTESQIKFYELLKKLNKDKKLTLVLVSHDIDVVAHEVSAVACINRNLVYHGQPKNVLQPNFMENLYGKHMKFVVHGH